MDVIMEAIKNAKKATTEAARRSEEEQLFDATEAREELREPKLKKGRDDR